MLVGAAGDGLFRLRRGPHVARASVEDHELARLREATPCLARRLSGSVPDARSPQCDPLPRNDVILHRQTVRPAGDVDPSHPPHESARLCHRDSRPSIVPERHRSSSGISPCP
jgi:hypothetical protein